MKQKRCPEEKSKKIVLDILESFGGFEIKDIPCKETQTADYLVSDANHKYIVEVTNTEPSAEFSNYIAETEKVGSASLQRGMNSDKRIHEKFKRKNKQIRATEESRDFNIIWATILTADSSYQKDATIKTLYGLSHIHVWDLKKMNAHQFNDAHKIAECFYYDDFTFRSLKWIDAIIVDNVLFINPQKDTSLFRTSRLFQSFLNKGWVFDPLTLIDDVNTYCLPFECNRGTDETTSQVFYDKYGFKSGKFVFIEFAQSFTVPKGALDAFLSRIDGVAK